MRTLAETTLALVLFSDASRIDLGALRRDGRRAAAPARHRAAADDRARRGGRGGLFGALTFWEAVILAVVLAPTDAALGQAVVTEPRVPQRIRQGLNVESGLNDGICVPLLFAAVAAADVESEIAGGRSAGTLLLEEIGYGVLGGVAAGLLVAAIVSEAGRRDLIAGPWRQVVPAAGAALAYGIASALDGSGFIAAFVAGMVFRLALGRDPEEINRLTDEVGSVLNGVTFILFGAVLLGPALAAATWQLVLYAVLSLTRRPDGARWRSPCWGRARAIRPSAFLGWFGPRGLASIVFAVIVIEESQLPHEALIAHAIYLTVGLSVLVHGLSAAPLAEPLRPLVRAPPARPAAAHGERPRRGRPPARSGDPRPRDAHRRSGADRNDPRGAHVARSRRACRAGRCPQRGGRVLPDRPARARAAHSPRDRQVGTVVRIRAVRERAWPYVCQRSSGPPPQPEPPSEPASADAAPEGRSASRNPWLWATAAVAVVAIALAVWGLHERSNAEDAKSDLNAQKKEAASAPPTTVTQTQTQTTHATSVADADLVERRPGRARGALAAAAAAFAAARKAAERRATTRSRSSRARSTRPTPRPTRPSRSRQGQAGDRPSRRRAAPRRPRSREAEAKQAEAEKRQLGAKAKAAAACAKSMLEIVGQIPKAASVDEGLKQAGDEIKALAPKCKDSVAAA